MGESMKLLSTWTGVLIVLALAVAMASVGVYQYAHGMRPTGAVSAVVLVLIALLLGRRVMRRRP
jgi:membrane protein implicated in regulation of membrane protease activity